jgi:hypothetical protein
VKAIRPAGLLVWLVLGGFAGCGPSSSPPSPEEASLSVEQWKAMPPDQKYQIETFERLKAGNPKFRNQNEWDKFTREVILPAKKKDFPNGKPR